MYRYEKSGEVHGLTRVRGLTQDDSHIYCTREQMKDELTSLLTFVLNLLKDFGLTDFYLELSTKDPNKYVGSDEIWEEATNTLAEVAKESNLELVDDPCGAAFYGPEDLRAGPRRHRPHLAGLDHPARLQPAGALPARVHREGRHPPAPGDDSPRPVRLHRTLLRRAARALRRCLPGVAGPRAGARRAGCRRVCPRIWPASSSPFEDEMVRCEIDYSDDRFGKKIRNASKSKVPFILIVGEEDMNNNAVSFRFRDGSQLNGVPVDTAREQILTVIKKRVQVNSADDFNAAVAE